MHLNRKVGPVSVRAWGLILNLIGNVLLLHGAIRFFTGTSGPAEMVVGGVITVGCILTLSAPTQ